MCWERRGVWGGGLLVVLLGEIGPEFHGVLLKSTRCVTSAMLAEYVGQVLNEIRLIVVVYVVHVFLGVVGVH